MSRNERRLAELLKSGRGAVSLGSTSVSDYFELLPYVSAGLFVVGSLGLMLRALNGSGHDKKATQSQTHTSEWRPTGTVDFVAERPPKDETRPAVFVLKVEEFCVVESPIGTKYARLRWRNASLAEAKQVASRQNQTGILLQQELPFVSAPRLDHQLAITKRVDLPSEIDGSAPQLR